MPNDTQQPGTEVATRQKPEIVRFGEQLASKAEQIKMALPAHITLDKFQRTVITAVQSDPSLLEADRQSLVLACIKAATDGLLPDKREAALVVFKERKKVPVEGGGFDWVTRGVVQYMPMVYGLRKKILQSNEVAALEVGVVYRAEVEAGKFLYEVGLEPPLRHRPMLELTEEQTSDDEIVAAYSIATMKDGTRSYEMMRRFEINKVRQCSQTGAVGRTYKFGPKKGEEIPPSGPWVEWFAEQAKKTVMRRHSKVLPQSGDIQRDVEGEELERAGASTAALLGSQEEAAPQIEHRSDEEEQAPHVDAETGEIHEERPTDGQGSFSDEREEPEKPKRTRRTRAQIDADNAAAQPPASETPPNDDPPEEVRKQREAEEREHNGGMTLAESAASGEEPEEPQSGTDWNIVAIDTMRLFDKAANVIDLKTRYEEAQLDIASMPQAIAESVEAAYQRRRGELGAQ